MTLQSWLLQATQRLSQAQIDSAGIDARLLLEYITGLDRAGTIARGEDELTDAQVANLESAIGRRLERVPTAYITNQRDFYGLNFYVDKQVLIPRPETEELVTYLVNNLPKSATVLELGTGSGAIAISLKHSRPDLQLTATDIDEATLGVAKRNAHEIGAEINFVAGNLYGPIKELKYDCVAANLPYVPKDAGLEPELAYEPQIALYSGDDGLDLYRQFFEELAPHLSRSGIAIIEADPAQFEALTTLASANNFVLQKVSSFVSLVSQKQ